MEWTTINSYFKGEGLQKLVEHQVESFEDFIRNKIPLIVSSTAPIVVWHEQDETSKKYKYELKLSFENISYMKPRIQEATGRIKPMFPQEARARNFTYAAQMFCDVRFVAKTYKGETLSEFDEQTKVFEGVSLGKIPVMLGSSLCIMKDYPISKEEMGECPYDPFGYFIIHGNERTILCQEKVADNCIMVFYNKKPSAKFTFSVEFKSLHESFTMPPKKMEIRISSKFNGIGFPLTMSIPRFREDIPLMIMFRAFGIESDEEIANLICPSNDFVENLGASFKECADLKVYTREDAINYLVHHMQYGTASEDKHSYVKSLLETEYLPHVKFGGDTSSAEILNTRKMLLTALVIRRLLLVSNKMIKIDDRDAYPNKRVVTTGALLTHLFRQLFQKACKDIRSKFVHEVNNDNWKKGTPRPLEILNVNNLYKILKVSTIDGKLKQALATGNFTVQGLGPASSASNATKMGVSQVLNRLSYSATLSHLRRIQTPVEKSGKLLAPRKLHGTSWGYVCPVETPEGHSVGIVKAMSMLTSITQHTPANIVINILEKLDCIEWLTTLDKKYFGTMIILNGVILGYTSKPILVNAFLRNEKRKFSLHPHTGISWNISNQLINIETDSGRFVRPLYRVENGEILKGPSQLSQWNEFIQTNIEYIDPCESETICVAMYPSEITKKHTHCEIHPTLIMGHMANSIPFSDHNQSPRNTYQSAMGKQAMGIFARNYARRLDKNGYILCSPMRPFVETQIMKTLLTHEMPSGDNIIVAIGCYGGYNQEDSVILNKASINRGLFRTLYYTMYKDEEHRNIASGKEEKFTKPRRENTRGFKASYHGVNEHGVPIMNATIKENDVVIGKVTSIKSDPNGYQYRDSSMTHKNAEECRIDGVWNDRNSDGYPFVKVRVVSERIPEIGDKFSSRHGQKGTCGIMLNEEDMPFSASGLRPDLIMNPHAVPSRMTIAQLMETMYGKVCCNKGTLGDGTPYSHLPVENIREQLLSLGMHPYGNEILYNGQTGEMMEAEIFMGPTFYQRLKHMVKDKTHSRARGPIVSLTRQPCEGRSRDGGLRVGEMERDCMLSHGLSMFTKERLMDVSDPFTTGFCKTCGTLAITNPLENIYSCGACGVKTVFEQKTIPYAVKLWSQELEAMHIVPRMVFE